MRNVCHYDGAHFIGYRADAGIIPVAAVSAGAAVDHLWLVLSRFGFEHIIIYRTIFGHTIGVRLVEFTAVIHRRAMR